LHSYNTNIIGSDSGGTGINMFAYTKELGGGLSASIAAEERTSRDKPIVNTIGTPAFFSLTTANGLGTGTASSQAGQTLPNFVGNLRFDQTWGALQVSAAAHKVAPAYYATGTAAAAGGTPLGIGGGAGGLTTLGHPDDAWGYAATIGTVLNLPTGNGDTFGAQFVYGKGASAYVGQGQGSLIVYRGSDIALGFVTDGVYGPIGSAVELTKGMSVTAGLQHFWSPNLRSSLYGGYERFQYDQAATGLLCAGLATGAGSAANAGGFTPGNCRPDFGFWQIGSRTVWNPVKELDVGFDVLYSRIDTAFGGPVTVSANGTQPAGPRFARDEGVLSAVFRVQRNFQP
jgi:hypothetical protein